VTVTDTSDGGVMVRAETGVKALSSRAQLVLSELGDANKLVNDIVESTGQTKETVKQALVELRRAGLVDGGGDPGKPHRYWKVTS
jgi:hypothetical protein